MQTKILGVDYGKRKIGLALTDTKAKLPEPYKVIKVKTLADAVTKVAKVAESLKVNKIVVGISEGKMAKETRRFAKSLGEKVAVAVSFQDETLSTKKAQRLSIDSQIPRKRRKHMEDAFSACVILTSYLETID